MVVFTQRLEVAMAELFPVSKGAHAAAMTEREIRALVSRMNCSDELRELFVGRCLAGDPNALFALRGLLVRWEKEGRS